MAERAAKLPWRSAGAPLTREERFRVDVITVMLFSSVIIMLTMGATLHVRGQTHIVTAEQAADALRHLAGGGAYLLFSLGILATGMLSVPVLAASTAYAVAKPENGGIP
ncbi:MAG: divalent metal cation transporter [Bryobacteraceae bacterium]|jgi:Mn2+/Fe2+ NRAMP family transporter